MVRILTAAHQDYFIIIVRIRNVIFLLFVSFGDKLKPFFMHVGRINLSGQGKTDQEILYAIDRFAELTIFDFFSSQKANEKRLIVSCQEYYLMLLELCVRLCAHSLM